jgi:hypothetical protein
MEGNIREMIQATKTLHERYLQDQAEIQQKTAEKEELHFSKGNLNN